MGVELNVIRVVDEEERVFAGGVVIFKSSVGVGEWTIRLVRGEGVISGETGYIRIPPSCLSAKREY